MLRTVPDTCIEMLATVVTIVIIMFFQRRHSVLFRLKAVLSTFCPMLR